MKEVPYWHFWNPMSGWRGGLINGAIIGNLLLLFKSFW